MKHSSEKTALIPYSRVTKNGWKLELECADPTSTYRGCRQDNIVDGGCLIEGCCQCERGVIDVDRRGVARHEGRGVGVCQREAGVWREGG